jgi:CTD small phosphatase-like protein 2
MNSGIRSLDKSQFVSFAQKLSKNKLQSHSFLKNGSSSKIQGKNNSNLIYSNIVPSKERSRSLNAMMSNVFKQPKKNEKLKKKESNDFKDLVSNLDESNIKIYESRKRNENSFCSDISDDLSMINKNFSRRDSNYSIETLSDKKSFISCSSTPYSMKIFENLGHQRNKNNNCNETNETTRPNSTKTSYNSYTNNSTINYSNINNTNNNYNNYTNAVLDDDFKDNLYDNPLSTHNNNNKNVSTLNSSNYGFNLSNNNTNYNTFRNKVKTIQNNNSKHINNLNRNKNNITQKETSKKYFPKIKFSNTPFSKFPINNLNYLNTESNNIIENTNNLKQSSSQKNILNNSNSKIESTKTLNSSSSTNDINKINKNSTIIQLEDLIVLEEKLFHILDNFSNLTSLSKLCIEWWNFYTYTTFGGKFEIFFPNSISQNHQIAHENSILELLSIILLYEILRDPKVTQSTLSNLKNLITEIHQNYLITCDYVLSTINDVNALNENIWINKLQNIIISKINHQIQKNEHMNLIKKGNNNITKIIKIIMKNYSYSTNNNKINFSTLNYYFKNVSRIRINTLNEYYRKKINQDCVKTGSSFVTFATHTDNYDNESIEVPYLSKRINRGKKFTLVLDLDETLISFHINEQGKGILIPRPSLHKFLTEMNKIFELILFTAGTQEYADPILNIIDKKKFFDKRLYRQHCVILDNVFVKDLSKLGRDLSKVIIIDNMPQNYKLQKDNGIFIKNFYGEDKNDSALLDLIPILKEVARNDKNDVRNELKKMKNEIFTKITTNLQ